MSTISELVEDWGGFEEFGGTLFENSSEVTVERNVKLYGRSISPRVVDLLVRQRTPPTSEIRTIIECKYLNRNVERTELDALRTVINETQCHKGVILSRVGFQKGAIAAAKELDIDLFTVRDFKASELAVDSSFDTVVLLVHLGFGDVFVDCPALAKPPSIILGANSTETIISLADRGATTLEAFLLETARKGVESYLPKGTVRFEGKAVDCTMSFVSDIIVEAVQGKPIPASFDMETIVHVNAVRALFGIRISQVILSYDDLNDFLFRVAVEDCVSKSVYRAARKKNAPATSFEKLNASTVEPRVQGKILALTMGTFLPFSEFDGLVPGGPSRLDGRSARNSETIASVREILAGKRL
ncbi:MAG: restriction endonuclease [Pseudomonadota bacterium]